MRREFSNWIENFGRTESRFIFLTGDLGFGALENVQNALQGRFINMGVCEQNMVSKKVSKWGFVSSTERNSVIK